MGNALSQNPSILCIHTSLSSPSHASSSLSNSSSPSSSNAPTSSSSIVTARKHKREVESYRHGLLRSVERFVINVYASGPRIDAMRSILESDNGVKSFANFVKSEHADEVYLLYYALFELLTLGPQTIYAISSGFAKLVNQYINPATASSEVAVNAQIKLECVAFLSADKDEPAYFNELKLMVRVLMEECVLVLAREQFHRFISSRHYKAWRSSEASHAMATTVEDTDAVMSSRRDKLQPAEPHVGHYNSLAMFSRSNKSTKSTARSSSRSRSNSLKNALWNNAVARWTGAKIVPTTSPTEVKEKAVSRSARSGEGGNNDEQPIIQPSSVKQEEKRVSSKKMTAPIGLQSGRLPPLILGVSNILKSGEQESGVGDSSIANGNSSIGAPVGRLAEPMTMDDAASDIQPYSLQGDLSESSASSSSNASDTPYNSLPYRISGMTTASNSTIGAAPTSDITSQYISKIGTEASPVRRFSDSQQSSDLSQSYISMNNERKSSDAQSSNSSTMLFENTFNRPWLDGQVVGLRPELRELVALKEELDRSPPTALQDKILNPQPQQISPQPTQQQNLQREPQPRGPDHPSERRPMKQRPTKRSNNSGSRNNNNNNNSSVVVSARSVLSAFSLNSMERKRRQERDLSVRAFISLDSDERARILGAESWMAALLAAVEGLPIMFSLCSARPEHRGYPCLFVNRYFERVTGFNRQEVLGKSMTFLQCPQSERMAVQQLNDAMKKGSRTSVVMINVTAQEKIFKNLIEIKPVFDDMGRYVYIMSIYIDVTREIDGYVSKAKLVSDLMGLLPDTILTDDADRQMCCCLPR